MDLVLGLDMGSSYFKLALFDRAGAMRGLGRVPAPAWRGAGSRCELPAEAFWQTLRTGLADALRQATAGPADIRGLSYGSQANSFLLLDDAGRPLSPLVLWSDGRAAGEQDTAIARLGQRDDFLATTGLGLFGHEFAAAKIRWFRRHAPELWRHVAQVQTLSDHLVYGLTGHRIGDAGTAALLGLYDLRRGAWWRNAFRELELDATLFSTPQPPGTIIGATTIAATPLLDLPPGVPVALGGLDHHLAAIGAGIGLLAPASQSTGTVVACLRLRDDLRPLPACAMGPTGLAVPPFYQLAFDTNGAAMLEWYAQHCAPDLKLPELLDRAATVPAGCDGLRALPGCANQQGLQGFTPAGARHGHGHYARAILELTAATLARLLDTLYLPDARPPRLVATGGAARSKLWLQIQADATGAVLIPSLCSEPACLGAGMMAAVAAGWFDSLADAGRNWVRPGPAIEPTSRRTGGTDEP